ncbi:hypothetical protein F5Y15DRAFT_415749 [Xylariaceae sp. FL0016]|nr:hypothetical protein F5Y15DRAFT_415749 [Xylariaceae sp. FL0016]
MVNKTRLGLKALQFLIRLVQFGCSTIILGIMAYFISGLHTHDMRVPLWMRAIIGLSGVGMVVSALGLFLLCCLAGHTVIAGLLTLLDLCLFGAFIYIAVANKAARGSCGRYINDSPLGSGSYNDRPGNGDRGFTRLPTYGTACRLQKAIYAVAIIGLFFFLFSILAEWLLVKNRKKQKSQEHQDDYPQRNYMDRFRKRGGTRDVESGQALRSNAPDTRASYATNDTAVGSDPGVIAAKQQGHQHNASSGGYYGNGSHAPGQQTVSSGDHGYYGGHEKCVGHPENDDHGANTNSTGVNQMSQVSGGHDPMISAHQNQTGIIPGPKY